MKYTITIRNSIFANNELVSIPISIEDIEEFTKNYNSLILSGESGGYLYIKTLVGTSSIPATILKNSIITVKEV